MNIRKIINDIVNQHSLKAQRSSYDRDVGVLAILKARETLLSIPDDADVNEYSEMVRKKMEELFNNYYDPEGEFTSGRSFIGSLMNDILVALDGL